MDADTTNLTANGFANCLTRDGQGSATANQPMNGLRHTNVGNGQAATDYLALGQYQSGEAVNWSTDSGVADAIAVTYTPALASLTDGQLCFVRAAVANATTTPTFSPNGLAPHVITKAGGVALAIRDIGGNAELILRYNLANTRWELLNPRGQFNPQLQNTNWIAAAGAADVITASYVPALTVLFDGLLCFFRASAANATTTPTFSPNGLTAHTITRYGGAALVASDIPAAAAEVILRYNLANTRWELLNPAQPIVTFASQFNSQLKVPTIQSFTSGSGATYTTPTSPAPLYLIVEMVGGGGGGGGSTANNGGTGGATSFGTLTAIGGGGGQGSDLPGGSGGTGGVDMGTIIVRAAGSGGGAGGANNAAAAVNALSGAGGCSPYGGAGGSATNGNGLAGAANSGSGGSGGGGSNTNGGGGGGAGEFVKTLITSPSATYTYTVGASGTAGAAGTHAGGVGGTGRITVTEYYQ